MSPRTQPPPLGLSGAWDCWTPESHTALGAATALRSRSQLRLGDLPSEELLQEDLTLAAWSTCKLKKWPAVHCRPCLLPFVHLQSSWGSLEEGRPGGQRLASLTSPPPFHYPSHVSWFQRCQSTWDKSRRPQD